MAFIPKGFVVKLGGNYRLIGGEVSRKAQLKGMKNGKQFCKFSVCAGVKPGTDDEKLYIDCVAYPNGNNMGNVSYSSYLDKGDPVLAAGMLKSREYEGKTYTDLELMWVNSPVVTPDAAPPFEAPQSSGYGGYDGTPEFQEDADDSELPF